MITKGSIPKIAYPLTGKPTTLRMQLLIHSPPALRRNEVKVTRHLIRSSQFGGTPVQTAGEAVEQHHPNCFNQIAL
jgi:hypothetical protein